MAFSVMRSTVAQIGRRVCIESTKLNESRRQLLVRSCPTNIWMKPSTRGMLTGTWRELLRELRSESGQWASRPQRGGPTNKKTNAGNARAPFRRDPGKQNQGGSGGKRGSSENGGPGQQGPAVGWELFLPPAIFIAMNMLSGSPEDRSSRPLTAQFFFSDILSVGECKRIEINREEEIVVITLEENAVVPALGDHPDRQKYSISVGSVAGFERQLEQTQRDLGLEDRDFVEVRYADPGSFGVKDVLSSILPIVLIASIYVVFSRRMRAVQASQSKQQSKSGGSSLGGPFDAGKLKNLSAATAEQSQTKFTDVAGLAEAKVEIREFVDFLRAPERFVELGAKPPKGALLVGPPGTGKTLIAKAVAGESDVPFYSVSGSDFVEMFVGVGASRVRDLFDTARANKPCIVYIDEIDAIGRARGDRGNSGGGQERESTLNQLLVEMDGFASEPGIVMLASTNRADMLDKALLRPGRFDRQIECALPTLEERRQLFELHCTPLTLEVEVADTAPRLAALTPGMSGAQIANICNEAALIAARRGATAVNSEDFDSAADRVIAGPEKRSRSMADVERRVVAVHESGHVLVAWHLEHVDPLLKTTIIPRASGALGFAQYLPSDKHLHSTEELEERLAVLLGGRAAEQVIIGKVTTGASDDLRRCSEIAYAMLTQYGMSKKVGNLSWDDFPRPEMGYRSASDAMSETIDREAGELVARAYSRAVELLTQHKGTLEDLSTALLQRETLQYDDVECIAGPRPFDVPHPYRDALSSQQSVDDTSDCDENAKSMSDGPAAAPVACSSTKS